jgi:hypothetical protein
VVSYRQYRSYGHGPFTAFTLSINPWLFMGVAVVIGIILGLFVF